LKYKLLKCFLLVTLLGFAQAYKLSDKAEVSIITVGEGASLNDTWGHSAIRIKDKERGFDIAYNYGIYDYDTPNFYTKFMQGKLPYNLGINQFHNFYRHYKEQNRSVVEQVLNLTKVEKQAYFDYLQNNAKPENKEYLYEFFFDNCATKIREVNSEILKTKVDYKDELFTQKYTFRDLIYQKTKKHPWSKFGIEIALGSVIDRRATPKEFTFLPSYIFKSFQKARVYKDGKITPLVKKTNKLYESIELEKSKYIFTPMLVFSILAAIIIGLTFLDYKRKKQRKLIDFSILFITGSVGLLVVLLWFATDHSATKNNFNIFWAFLPNLYISFYVFKENKQVFLKKYYLVLTILLFIGIAFWIFRIQQFNLAMIPIFMLLGVRYIYNYNVKLKTAIYN